MHMILSRLRGALILASLILVSLVAVALPLKAEGLKDNPATHSSKWEFTFTPYFWAFWMNADQTVKGQTVSIDAHLFEILSNSDGLNAMPWYSAQEARLGRFSLYSDIQYSNLGFSGGQTASTGLGSGLSIAGTLDFELAVLEGGVTYEISRLSRQTALDVTAGLRYWYMNVDLNLAVAGPLPPGLTPIGGGLAVAKSGDVDWVDPVIGLRLRHEMSPSQRIVMRGDIGGFGAGSDFTWQLLGAYSFDFAQRHGITFSGKIGYRALSVDYVDGVGSNRFAYDAIQHGPIVGLGMKW